MNNPLKNAGPEGKKPQPQEADYQDMEMRHVYLSNDIVQSEIEDQLPVYAMIELMAEDVRISQPGPTASGRVGPPHQVYQLLRLHQPLLYLLGKREKVSMQPVWVRKCGPG